MGMVTKRPSPLSIKGLLVGWAKFFSYRNQRVISQPCVGQPCDTSRVSYHVFMLTINSALLSLKNICWDEHNCLVSSSCLRQKQENAFCVSRMCVSCKKKRFFNPSENKTLANIEGGDQLGSKISAVERAKLSQGIIRQKNYLRRTIRQKNYIGQIIQRSELSENYDGSSCWVRSCFCHLLLSDNRRNSLEKDFGRGKSSKTE